MKIMPILPKRAVVAANPQIPDAAQLAAAIASYLADHHLAVVHGLLNDEEMRQHFEDESFDLMVALGGDGTMLRAGHLGALHRVPILGINLGRVGFLTEVKRGDWKEALDRVLEGDYWLENRMMLLAEHYHDGKMAGAWNVLNECVIGRGEIVRPVRLVTETDGRYLTTYVADALIAATATGSTAYALAAGGPILPPELRNILLVPVASHLTLDRAIVLHEGSSVRVRVLTDHQAILSVDGRVPVMLEDRDEVALCAGEHEATFVRLQDPGYFYRNLTSYMNSHPSLGGRE